MKDPKDTQFPVVHGGYTYLKTGLLPCKGCPNAEECADFDESGHCKVVSALLSQTITNVMQLSGIDPSQDSPLAVAYAREIVFQTVFLWRMQAGGIVKDGPGGEPVTARLLRDYGSSVNRMLNLARVLGITPAQRHELKTGKNLAALMSGVDK